MEPEALFSELALARIVYVGETHDDAAHHALQALVLRESAARRPVFLGLEMLDVTRQGDLDAYLSGRLGEAEFAELWRKAWGFPFELYRPLLEAARAAGVPVRALNAPSDIVRQVARAGLASLSPEQRRLLPDEIRPISDPRYLAWVRRALNQHGPLDPEREARALEAMAVWNETMAESVLEGLRSGRSAVVAVGMGHVLYRAGIAESVRSRACVPQSVLLPYAAGNEGPSDEERAQADYFWLLPAPPGASS